MDLVTFTEENINGNLDFLSSIFWKTIPFSIERDVFQRYWSKGLTYAFPSFNVIGRVLAKVQRKKVTDLGAFCLANSDMVPKIARNGHSKPDSSFKLPRVINKSKKGVLFTVTKTIRKTSSMYSFR